MKSSFNAISELPSFPLVSDQSCIIGNVTIHPKAAIAPGVVIQAADDSQVIIEAGACLGMGVVIKAYQGIIVIEQGAVLGARVLMIGKGRIGNHACVGAATTILNSSVEPMLVINAYSVLGDSSRFYELEIVEDPLINQSIDQTIDQTISEQVNDHLSGLNEAISDPWDDESKSQLNQEFVEELKAQIEPEELSKPELIITEETKIELPEKTEEVLTQDQPLEVEEVKTEVKEISESSSKISVESLSENLTENLTKNLETEITEVTPKAPVVGKVYINNLLLTLFPNRQSTY